MQHHVSYRAYFEDTDAGGVVYHANYLNFCERARTELLLDSGFTNRDLQKNLNVIFVIRHIESDYFKPIFLEDKIDIYTTISDIRRSSTVFDHIIKRGDDVVYSAKMTLVCVDSQTVRPVQIPEAIKKHFEEYV